MDDFAKDPSDLSDLPVSEKFGTDFTYKHKIKWINVTGFALFYITGILGAYMYVTIQMHSLTFIYDTALLFISVPGVTMGAHRYFSHRSFKAKPILRRILFVMFCLNGQNTLWHWVRDHRQHHKYSDTDADPHNASRGLFFAHIGWLMTRKHPKVIQYSKGIDMSDLSSDPWIMLQKKYVAAIHFVLCMVFVPSIPVLLWNEDPLTSFLVCYSSRTCFSLNLALCVNSLAHTYGTRTYDTSIRPSNNSLVNFLTIGDGYHNYHHVFPWDYRSSEFGIKSNMSTYLIDFFANIGWVYDRKTASEDLIKCRMMKTGEKLSN